VRKDRKNPKKGKNDHNKKQTKGAAWGVDGPKSYRKNLQLGHKRIIQTTGGGEKNTFLETPLQVDPLKTSQWVTIKNASVLVKPMARKREEGRRQVTSTNT